MKKIFLALVFLAMGGKAFAYGALPPNQYEDKEWVEKSIKRTQQENACRQDPACQEAEKILGTVAGSIIVIVVLVLAGLFIYTIVALCFDPNSDF